MIKQRRVVCLLGCLLGLLIAGPAAADDGWYAGVDFGVVSAPALNVDSSSPKFPSGACSSPCSSKGGSWSTLPEINGSGGFMASLTGGYRWRNLRFEGDYFYRATRYDDTNSAAVVDSTGKPVPVASVHTEATSKLEIFEAVEDVLSHNIFFNVLYDFHPGWLPKWTPYLGFGGGISHMTFDFSSRWNTGEKNIDSSLTNNSSGKTTSVIDNKLVDLLVGYQAIAGLDYRLSESASIGLKFRWVDFGTFKGEEQWQQIDATGGSSYNVSTGNTNVYGFAVNLKHYF